MQPSSSADGVVWDLNDLYRGVDDPQLGRDLDGLYEQMDKPAVYASLVHAAKTDDPRHGALLARTREQRTAINKHLIFFDLEWVKVADESAHALIHDPRLARYHHYLEHK